MSTITNRKYTDATYKRGCNYLEDECFYDAAMCFQIAAKAGHIDAQERLGELYMSGMGVKKDMVQGVMWLRKSAAQNHPVACFALGYNYLNGYGLKQSNEEAKKWFQKAIENGSRTAQMWLDKLND